ncbi:MAG: hypothetical protein ACO1SX_21675, partial [Actinomycetota bacterium]
PADAARELQHLLRAPVEVRGGEGRKITLHLPANTPPLKALDRVAAQMGGSWRMKLQVKAGEPEPARATPLVDHNVALGLQDVTASRAFSLVARELKAELELEGDLETRVSVIVVNVTANVLLDKIAEQAGATWDVSYVIDAPNVPQPIVVLPSRPAPVVTPPPAPMPEPVAPPRPRIASAAELRTELRGHINQIVKAEPSRRAEVVRDFIQHGEALLLLLDTLSPAERAERLRALAKVVTPWRRLYQGLAPEVHKELAPVTALLARLRP